MQNQHSQVRLDIEFLDSERAYERVRLGEIELAVVTLAPGNVTQLATQPLWNDPLAVMVSPDHPLATASELSLADLAAYPAVLPGLDTFTGRIVREHFARHGHTLQLGMATNYLETLRMMASVGLGWTVLPETMLGDWTDRQEADQNGFGAAGKKASATNGRQRGGTRGHLKKLRVKGTRLERSLGLVLHEQRSLSRSAQAFHELLIQQSSTERRP